MAKLVVFALCAVAAGVLAEPPSSYLPPQARNGLSSTYGAPNGNGLSSTYGAPNGNGLSSTYGAPNGNGGFNGNGNGKISSFHAQRTGSKSFSYNSLHENQFGGAQSRKSNGKSSNGFGSNGFGGISQQYGAPSQSYKAPGQNGGAGRGANGLSQQYGAPSFGASGNGFGLSKQYGAPSFDASSSNGFGLSQQYGAPGFGASGNGFGLSQQYGAPGFGASGNGFSSRKSSGAKFGAPAPVYGAPSSRYGVPSKMDDDLAEPANYEYTYEVQAAEESGAEFGHQESREDEFAKGVYHVLLPDGRTQIVEYEADEEGFRPVIRYEEPSGYPAARGPQGPY